MIDFLLAGHGTFASGLTSSIKMIFGECKPIEIVNFLDGETKTELDKKMDTALDRHQDAVGILLFCDVLQGSPFQCAAERAMRDCRIRVVFGTNLPMLVECVSRSTNVHTSVDELAKYAVGIGADQVGLFDPRKATAADTW